jgi:hypothetical protein
LFNNPFLNLGASPYGGADLFVSGKGGKTPQPQFGLVTSSGSGNPFEAQGDQLSAFRAQMQSGAIAPNLYQPALPYTATKGWIG